MIKAVYLIAFVGAVLGTNQFSDTRIINGYDAVDGEIPWQVSLQEIYSGGYWHFCGGSLISQNYIMTAAHCKKDNVNLVSVYAGSIDKFNGGVRLPISSFIGHPEYDSNSITMDYGIIQLSYPVELTANIQTIPIVGANFDYLSEFTGSGTTSGWGYISYKGQNSPANQLTDILQVADVPILSDNECDEAWGTFYDSHSMICAGGVMDNGVCMGDSGGPLVQKIDGVTTLIGATSWAPSTCTTRLPSGWAKLSTVRDWIIRKTDLQ